MGRVAGAIFSDGSTSSPHCASAQWERQIAGFDRAVASYLCAGSNGTENNGQSWVSCSRLVFADNHANLPCRLSLQLMMLKKLPCP